MKAKKLDIWKRSSRLCSEIYIYFKSFRDYGFKDQITRSALSVPSNIAEGVEKSSDKETIRHLDIARGSIAEIQTQIYIGIEVEYIDKKTGGRWIDEYEEVSKMISSFINSLRKR
jgi:four helix bundle protein